MSAETPPEQITPATEVVNYTPADSADVDQVGGRWPKGFSFGAAGTIRVVTLNGTTINFTDGSLSAGTIHPLRIKQLHATGTTATDFYLFY